MRRIPAGAHVFYRKANVKADIETCDHTTLWSQNWSVADATAADLKAEVSATASKAALCLTDARGGSTSLSQPALGLYLQWIRFAETLAELAGPDAATTPIDLVSVPAPATPQLPGTEDARAMESLE